ncbi:polymer-forming cytoskeletal protein [Dysgonomonas sp. 216]|uniref:bactofilin family protein n=1 Tax=Dysgonomonas sp. 216 TaxID=2302934 RepID=UPI0013D8B6CA|nr:polymer-forming cytoskeletal protein [Dysgonomonas sp. 216]
MFFKRKGKYHDYSTEHSSLRQGLSIIGDIESPENILIDCRIEGNITCGGRIIVGKDGNIQGNIRAAIADIHGKVTGDTDTAELLVLRSTSQIEGRITSAGLEVEQGASIKGSCCVVAKNRNERVTEKEIYDIK